MTKTAVDWQSEARRLHQVAVELLARAHHDDRCNRLMSYSGDGPCDCRKKALADQLKASPAAAKRRRSARR